MHTPILCQTFGLSCFNWTPLEEKLNLITAKITTDPQQQKERRIPAEQLYAAVGEMKGREGSWRT